MRKGWMIGFLVVLIGCGAQETAQLPTQTPVVVTQVVTQVVKQVVTQVVTATPLPATPTPKATATPAATETPKPTGKWTTDKTTSSFDDSTTVVLTLDAESDIPGTVGSVRPVLFVRCKEHVKDAYVYTGNQPDVESGNLDGATVRMRFDSDPAMTHNAGKSTDGEALFLDPGQKFIDLLLKHQKMVFEFTPFNGSPTEINFDVRGLPEAIAPLNEACK